MDVDAGAPGFRLRAVEVEPGCDHVYRDAEWRDAIVSVSVGEIELVSLSGSRHRFKSGDVLWLAGLPLRALHNCGAEPVLLLAVSRR
jgi:hypothetical protein